MNTEIHATTRYAPEETWRIVRDAAKQQEEINKSNSWHTRFNKAKENAKEKVLHISKDFLKEQAKNAVISTATSTVARALAGSLLGGGLPVALITAGGTSLVREHYTQTKEAWATRREQKGVEKLGLPEAAEVFFKLNSKSWRKVAVSTAVGTTFGFAGDLFGGALAEKAEALGTNMLSQVGGISDWHQSWRWPFESAPALPEISLETATLPEVTIDELLFDDSTILGADINQTSLETPLEPETFVETTQTVELPSEIVIAQGSNPTDTINQFAQNVLGKSLSISESRDLIESFAQSSDFAIPEWNIRGATPDKNLPVGFSLKINEEVRAIILSFAK